MTEGRFHRIVPGVLLGVACATASVPAGVPADYAGFERATARNLGRKLTKAAARTPRPLAVFLPQGESYLDNPVLVRRPLHLHGGNMYRTTLIPRDPTRPLFVVEGRHASRMSVAGVAFTAKRENRRTCEDPSSCPPCSRADKADFGCPAVDGRPVAIPNQIAFSFRPTLPREFELEMYDSQIYAMSLEIAGPGSYRLQNTDTWGAGHVQTPILVDHPEADFVHVGGSSSSGVFFRRLPFPDRVASPMYNHWLRRGRLRIFGGIPVQNFGNADVRIDSAAPRGEPHVIAGVRSEGVNDLATPHPSALVYVPRTEEEVDVLILAVEANFAMGDLSDPPSRYRGTAHVIDYNGAGTVWMAGVTSEFGLGRLAIGSAPRAALVAVGNRTFRGEALSDGARAITAANLYSWARTAGCPTPGSKDCRPISRFLDPSASLSDYPEIPRIPRIDVPDPALRPRVSRAADARMLDATWCGAVPDDGRPDTRALQHALDWALTGVRPPGSDCRLPRGRSADRGTLFLPAGTYHVDRPLLYFHESQPRDLLRRARPTLWLAGAGSERTRVVNVHGGGVFATSSLFQSTIQGIEFRTDPYTIEKDASAPTNVSVEYVEAMKRPPRLLAATHATQQISFHDCVFDGGKYALGVATETGIQSDHIMTVRSKFRNAKYGYAQGGQNALGNIIYDPDAPEDDPTFSGNHYAMGHPDPFCASPACCDNPLESPGPGGGRVPDPPRCDREGRETSRVHDVPGAPPCRSTPPPIVYGGAWHVLGATVRGTREQDLPGLYGPSYFFEYDSDTEVLHDSCRSGATGSARVAVFHQSKFAHADPTTPMIDWRSGGGLIFLRTELQPGFRAPRLDVNTSLASAFFVDLDGPPDRPLWRGLSQPWNSLDQIHRDYRRVWAECEVDADCHDGCGCTRDVCRDGICRFDAGACDDGIACTVDGCPPGGGSSALSRDRFDRDFGRLHDPLCDDGDPCTRDVCDPHAGAPDGCVHRPDEIHPSCPPDSPDRTPVCSPPRGGARDSCDDRLACNGREVCRASGECEVLPGSVPACGPEEVCVEFTRSPRAEPAGHCVAARCPVGRWCAELPRDDCRPEPFPASACRTDYGGVLGCPEGQTIYRSSCCDDDREGAYWQCGPE